MKNDAELRKTFVYFKYEAFQKHLHSVCWTEKITKTAVNLFNKKKWKADMLHSYELLISVHDKLFETLYDSEEEYLLVMKNFSKIALHNYKMEGRTELGNYVEQCFSVFSFIVISKILYFNGTSKDSYNTMLKQTDMGFQYLEELLAKSNEFGC